MQRRICSSNPQSDNNTISESSGQFIFDANGPCLAYAAKLSLVEIGHMDSCVHLVSPTDFSPFCAPLRLPWPVSEEPVEWLHLSLQGHQLITVCGHPSHSLDIWELTQTSEPQQPPKHLAHIPLEERLSLFKPSAFPLNPQVICSLGRQSLRLIRYEPGLTPLEGPGNLSSVFQHDVDLMLTLLNSEVISSPPIWTPSGSILLGTSQGRVRLIALLNHCQ
jgi:hypothetical protein